MLAKRTYKKKKKRVGRGVGSGCGKTSSRGQKGQGSRSGSGVRVGFEGGQNPIIRRIPKRGFTPPFKITYSVVNLSSIAKLKETDITAEILVKYGFIRKVSEPIKILGDGELKKGVTVFAHSFSESAKDKIEKAGGKAIVV